MRPPPPPRMPVDASTIASARNVARSDGAIPLEVRPLWKLQILMLCLYGGAAVAVAIVAGVCDTYTTPVISVVTVHDKHDSLIVTLEQRGGSVQIVWFVAVALGAAAICAVAPVANFGQYYTNIVDRCSHIRHIDRAVSYPPLMVCIAIVSGSASPAITLSVSVITCAFVGFLYSHDINTGKVVANRKPIRCDDNTFWFIAMIPFIAVWAIMIEPYTVVTEDTPFFVDMLFYIVPVLHGAVYAAALVQSYSRQDSYHRIEMAQIVIEAVFKLTIASIIVVGALVNPGDVSGASLIYNGSPCVTV